MNDKPLPCHLDPDYLYDAKVEAKLERDAMTPQQQAQEWVRNNTSWVDTVPSDLAGIPHTETWLCEANDCKRAFLAGHAAGKQEERERVLAILEHGCPTAPVQFTYAKLRMEIHEITDEDCYTGGEKV